MKKYLLPCDVPECGRKCWARQLCAMHYQRWKKHGDPLIVLPHPGPPFGYQRKENIGYGGVHDRVRRRSGSACEYPCFHCGQRADSWAYDHKDPEQRTEVRNGREVPYSLDLDRYEPLCHSCHGLQDQNRLVS